MTDSIVDALLALVTGHAGNAASAKAACGAGALRAAIARYTDAEKAGWGATAHRALAAMEGAA